MVKLNVVNLHELKNRYRTETANYIYMVEPLGVNIYRLVRRSKTANKTAKSEAVKMPEIYRGYFKNWRWSN